MGFQIFHSGIRQRGAAVRQGLFIKIDLWMVLWIMVAFIRFAGCQRQHQRGNLLADIGKILGTAALTATQLCGRKDFGTT